MIASRIAHSRKKIKKYKGRAGRMITPTGETLQLIIAERN